MELETTAARFAELGHPSRLAIFRLLVKAGADGLPVGSIQSELEIPASTLSHHLSRLVSVGLIKQDRDGRTLHCKPQFPALQEVVEFLLKECCVGAEPK